MSENYYRIEPDLNDDQVAYIEDWDFTYWPNIRLRNNRNFKTK